MLDIVAHNYGKLPSEIASLDWKDLALCVAALKTRTARLDKMIRKTTRKKSMVFPVLNISDLINGL